MPDYISESLHCSACDGYYDDTIERSKRDEKQECVLCGAVDAVRTYTVPHISTAKMSESIPDIVAQGRFASHKLKNELRKAKANARDRQDWVSEGKINDELKKVR